VAVVDQGGDALGREDVRVQGRLPVLPGLQSDTAQAILQPELLEYDDRLCRQGSGVNDSVRHVCATARLSGASVEV